MKQELLKEIQGDIKNLNKKKKKGYKVGKLKFKKNVQTIPLKQFNITYKLQEPNKIRIQGLKKWLTVRGMKQFPENAEFTNSKLLWRHGDFYLHVTTYTERKPLSNPS